MNSATHSGLRTDIINAIMSKVHNPAEWFLACRKVCEDAGLNPARCLPLSGTLETVVFAIVEEVKKQGRADGEALLREAIAKV